VFDSMLVENQAVRVRRSTRHVVLSEDICGDDEVRSAFESRERIPGFDDLPPRFGEFSRGSVVKVQCFIFPLY
jgi:hypothetical protein